MDATVGGALMGKVTEVAKTFLEEITSNNYHWPSERASLKRSTGKNDVDAVTLLASRVNALAQRLDRVGTIPALGSSYSGPSDGVSAIYETYGVQGHTSVECYNGPPSIEHANAMHGFNPLLPQNNPYPNAHSSG